MKRTITLIVLILLVITVYVCNICKADYKKSSFDLRDKINIDLEYQTQNTYMSCWIFNFLDSIETNIMLHQNKKYNFSESHIEYMTSIPLGGDRNLEFGGTYQDVIKYVKDGKGPVLQEKCPNNRYTESQYDFLKNQQQIIKNVNTIQFKENENKNIIKKHIVNNGSISALLYFRVNDVNEFRKFYNHETSAYCNKSVDNVTHCVSIIGWDDNYSKNNFPEENKPNSDGAWLVLSYWKEFDVIYVSYEDILINKEMIGVESCEF